ncbi:MAG: site-specific integrase [Chlorobium sp.]|nr:site-specific integrase [Chlorobium sp.]
MGVKIRVRGMSGGEVAFYIDTYHKDFGRFSQKTGLQANPNPKNNTEFKRVKAEAEDMRRKIERDFIRDPAGVFSRKAVAGDDFVGYVRERAEKDRHSSYLNTLKRLIEFTGGSISFESLNSQWLERFKSYLLSVHGLSSNSANTYLLFMKGTIRLAYKEGYVNDDFTGKVAGIGKQPIERHVLTFDELDVLSRSKCNNLMVKAAFLFSCFTGLRLSDIELLKWEKILVENGQHFVKFQQKKTGQLEKMPLCAQAVEILQSVQNLHADYAPGGDDRVFILPTRPRLGIVLNEWGYRSGLNWRLHFHASRHTFASMALSAGTAFFTVSKLLGHRDLKTTEIYSHSNQKDQIKAIEGLPMLSPVIEPQSVALSVPVIASIPEQILQPQRAVTTQVGSIAAALQAKGEKVASVLSLVRNAMGKYEFNGIEYTAVELAMEV